MTNESPQEMQDPIDRLTHEPTKQGVRDLQAALLEVHGVRVTDKAEALQHIASIARKADALATYGQGLEGAAREKVARLNESALTEIRKLVDLLTYSEEG